MALEASLIATIVPIIRHLEAHARRRRAWNELTYAQYKALRTVDTTGPTTLAELARHLMVSAPVVTRLAAALTSAGLVERDTDPRDRRAVFLHLTTPGRRRVRAMRRDLLEAANELLKPIPEEKRASLGNALEELRVLLLEPSAPV